MKHRNSRQDAIREIIRGKSIKTQRALVDELKAMGFNCTQATVSRDISDMGLRKLPEGVYGVPYISMDDLTYQPDVSLAGYNLIAKQPALAAYVHDLYEVSPDSTFNLYVVDVYICLVQHVLYANKIPSSQYYIYMLSDGTASASRFNSFYNRADAQAHHDELTAEWQGYKDYAYETGEVSSEVPDVGSSRWYCALLSCEDGEQRRLTRTVLRNQSYPLTGANGETDVVEQLQCAKRLREVLYV